jgi:hypothetical protein
MMMIRLAIPDRTVPYIITVKLHGSLFDVSRSARARTKTEVVHLLLSTSCPSMHPPLGFVLPVVLFTASSPYFPLALRFHLFIRYRLSSSFHLSARQEE